MAIRKPQVLIGKAADFTTENRVLADNEIGIEYDTGYMKVGDGTTRWASLDYMSDPATAFIDDTAYDATSWNGDTDTAPSKNAVRDKIEAMIDDTAYNATTWNGVATVAPSQNAVRDKIEAMVDDTAYNATTWDGATAVAPSKNAVRDKIEAMISDTAYDATSWNGDTNAPTKNAVRDKIEAMISDTAYDATSWNGDTNAPTKNAVRDKIEAMLGRQTIWIPASAMIAATTSGPASAQLETATNKQNYSVLDFDATADESAHFQIAMPKGWNEGTIAFQVWWSSTATDTDGVAWALEAGSYGDNEAIDAAFGTPVVVTDACQSAAGEVYISAESAAVTIAGSPAAGDLCFFRFFRDVSDAADTAAEDARLIGIKLFYTVDAFTDD